MLNVLYIAFIGISIFSIPKKKLETGIYYVKEKADNSTLSVFDKNEKTMLWIDTLAICTKVDLKNAKVEIPKNANVAPTLLVELTEVGKHKFAVATKRWIGNRLAVFIDGEIILAPYIQEEISGGRFQISGNFSVEELTTLKNKLIENPETN